MRVRRRIRTLGLLAVLALTTSGCYFQQALLAAQNGDPVPWFCNPTAYNSVTGPGMGTIDFYAGVTRAPLDETNCALFAAQLDVAKQYAEQFPTLGDAVAAGFTNAFNFIPTMGTHHAFQGITPELLNSPAFDPLDPIVPNSVVDGTFSAGRPEFLQYNGNDADDVLVGMSWYVRTTNGLPPAGFAGNNDWWHHHPRLCLSRTTAEVVGVSVSDSTCAQRNGINAHMQNYYMLHTWQVTDLEYQADVFAPFHPCITATGAIFDMDDPCHDVRLQTPPQGGATAGASPAAASSPTMFCPLVLINDQWETGADPS